MYVRATKKKVFECESIKNPFSSLARSFARFVHKKEKLIHDFLGQVWTVIFLIHWVHCLK